MKVILPFPGAGLVVFAMTALVAACASQPGAETAKASAASAQRLAGSDPVVCRDVVVTGSHTSEPVCHTRKEWDQIDYARFVHSQRPASPGSNAGSPSADVGVQTWAPGMPVPSQPPPSR